MSKLKIAYFSMWGFNKGWWPRWDIVSSYLVKKGFQFMNIGFLESKKAHLVRLDYTSKVIDGVYYFQFYIPKILYYFSYIFDKLAIRFSRMILVILLLVKLKPNFAIFKGADTSLAILALFLKRIKFLKTKLILDFDDPVSSYIYGEEIPFTYRIYFLYNLIILKIFDGVIVLSNIVKNFFSNINKKIFVLPQLVFINNLNNKTLKTNFGISLNSFVILTTGVIRKNNLIAITKLIKALGLININKVVYVIAGPAQNDGIAYNLKILLSEAKRKGVTIIYKENCSSYELKQLMNAADLYFHAEASSRVDFNIPIRLAYALASGIPILTPKALAIMYYINKPKFLYDPRSPEDIAKKLEEIIKNPEKEYFVQISKKYFSKEHINKMLEDFANSLINM